MIIMSHWLSKLNISFVLGYDINVATPLVLDFHGWTGKVNLENIILVKFVENSL